MSQNPYQSAPTLPNPVIVPQQKPGGLTAVAVISLIIGVMGVLMSLFAIAMLFLQGTMNQFPGAQTGGPETEIITQMEAIQANQFLTNLVFGSCNVIIGSLLAIGSIGVLGTKEWGRNLLRNSLLAAILFVIVRGICTMWIQYQAMSSISKMIPSGSEGGAAMQTVMQVSIIVGIVFGVIWMAGLIGFYVWGRIYLNKPPIKALFDAAN